jgi:hypothetical protein
LHAFVRRHCELVAEVKKFLGKKLMRVL